MKAFWKNLTRSLWSRWALAAVLSIMLHFSSLWAVQLTPKSPPRRHYKLIRFRLVRPRIVKPRQPKKKRKTPPRPKPKKRKKKRIKRKKKIKHPPPKKKVIPPPNQKMRRPPPPNTPPPTPIFGLTMSSLGKGKGSKIAVKVGNTLMKEPDRSRVPPHKIRPYFVPRHRRIQPKRKDIFKPIPVYEVDQNPREWKKVRATYPTKAKSLGLEARVVLSVEIRRNGRIRRVRVISIRPSSSRHYGFGKAAIKALRHFRFHPARYKGKPVDVIVRYIYRFELED